ncbi:insulinase family protein [Glutamicibacter sp. PS]|uniref:M16 family metallopeptidase n=1 Tax=Glutamicibacter sp. PS TaxID=3075634 RepID=UPI00285147E7|nr:insulinase family protein [Glutamicibacter sp. PS]MDR4533619.1 insulinase family protein [Glutamicibacter sp. PS]
MSCAPTIDNLTLRGLEAKQCTLPSGARVLAISDPRAKNLSLSLTIPAGMRHEQAMEHGTMHLIEHLVYQDSAQIGGLERQRTVAAAGGTLGGNTHMDYTEFYETGPVGSATPVARRLIEQVFYPRLSENQIEEQIQAVAAERAHRLHGVPGQRLPWPHLTGLYWSDYGSGHDGSGDTDLRGRVHAEQLRRIHRRYYRPEHCVLVALTPRDPLETVVELADVMAEVTVTAQDTESEPLRTPRAAPNPPHDQHGHGDRHRLIAVTQAAPARTVTDAFLGDTLTAELLAGQPGIDAAAGIFGLGDSTLPDLFVLIDDTNFTLDPAERLRAVSTAKEEKVQQAVRRAHYRAQKFVVDDERLVRTVARDLVLRDCPEFTLHLSAQLGGLRQDIQRSKTLIDESCQRLAGQPMATLTIRFAS